MPKRTNDGIKKRCDCRRKNWPKCSHPWHFALHHNEREYRFSLDKIAHARGERPPTTKADALTWRDQLRNEIRAGTFVDPDASPLAAMVDTRLTFGDVCDQYLDRHVRKPTRRPRARREMETLIAMARRAEIPAAHGTTLRLEQKPIDAITKADVEAVRIWRRQEQAAGKSRRGTKGGEVGINRLLSRMRHLFNWAIAGGYLTDTPFKRGPVTVLKLETSVEGARTRRLDPTASRSDGTKPDSEEARILKHADPHLRALLVAALTTGCRIGELLSLQWKEVRRNEKGEARWLTVLSANEKNAKARVIPIGPRLRAELEILRHAPDGKEHPPTAYVFGNETGERVLNVRRQWEDAVLRAHGHTPTRKRGKLTAESQAAYQAIDLHVHDLRRQFACSLLESGAALHDVQAFLGHANITTTSRYLQSAPVRLEQALTRMEEAAGFAHHSHKPASEAPSEPPKPSLEISRNSLN